MTVAELIAQLSRVNQDAEVVTSSPMPEMPSQHSSFSSRDRGIWYVFGGLESPNVFIMLTGEKPEIK